MLGIKRHPFGIIRQPYRHSHIAFFLAMGLGIAIFLPFIIYNRGYFTYYGDYNVQQIPFYKLAHEAVRSGNIAWSWQTDLGANFIGSYSFYLLGSPFFWLTLPFPTAAVPYLMAPLLILKTACASLFAFQYLRRFVKSESAVLGGLLYAFSGYAFYNIFFNHFHEAIVLFPLMLLGMERLVADGKRGLFGLAVFFSALSNYYFFIGQVVFLVIYWVVRMVSGGWRWSFARFCGLLTEAVLGTGMAAFLLLPSFFAVIQNNRVDNLITGWDALYYDRPQRFWDIIHSYFFPQDIPARPNFFPDSDNKWASMSAWLPVFSCSGVLAFFQLHTHRHWLRRMLFILIAFSLIPGLNAAFQLFNAVYYARWFYMLTLMLSLATVAALPVDETAGSHHFRAWRRALAWTGGITLAFFAFIAAMPKAENMITEKNPAAFGLGENLPRMIIFTAMALASLVMAGILLLILRREPKRFFGWAMALTSLTVGITGWYLIGLGTANTNYTPDYVIRYNIEQPAFSLPGAMDGTRIDVNNGMDNQGMFWGLNSIQAFHSIVPGSVMEFYPSVGVDRGVGSRPEASHYALRSLLSVRWLFEFTNPGGKEFWDDKDTFERNGRTAMPGWSLYDTQHDFRIYENECYIPMGFTYEYFITRSAYEEMPAARRELALLKGLVVENADLPSVRRVLRPLTADDWNFTEAGYIADCAARNTRTVSDFRQDQQGFSAAISLDAPNLVFFSVPYEDGWSAKVNGESAKVYKVNVGFMAVLVPAGTDVPIRFIYTTPGLSFGAAISGLCGLLFVLYGAIHLLARRRKTPPGQPAATESNLIASDSVSSDISFTQPSSPPSSQMHISTRTMSPGCKSIKLLSGPVPLK